MSATSDEDISTEGDLTQETETETESESSPQEKNKIEQIFEMHESQLEEMKIKFKNKDTVYKNYLTAAALEKLLTYLQSDPETKMDKDSLFMDFGCRTGKVVMSVAATLDIKLAMGIEVQNVLAVTGLYLLSKMYMSDQLFFQSRCFLRQALDMEIINIDGVTHLFSFLPGLEEDAGSYILSLAGIAETVKVLIVAQAKNAATDVNKFLEMVNYTWLELQPRAKEAPTIYSIPLNEAEFRQNRSGSFPSLHHIIEIQENSPTPVYFAIFKMDSHLRRHIKYHPKIYYNQKIEDRYPGDDPMIEANQIYQFSAREYHDYFMQVLSIDAWNRSGNPFWKAFESDKDFFELFPFYEDNPSLRSIYQFYYVFIHFKRGQTSSPPSLASEELKFASLKYNDHEKPHEFRKTWRVTTDITNMLKKLETYK